MARYRSFLFPKAILKDDVILLDDRESHHLARVFRAKAGETIEVLDGKGTHYAGEIQSVSSKAVRVQVKSVKKVSTTRPRVQLLQSESRAKTMDIVLRMATEIGVATVQPVFTERGEHLQRNYDKRLLTMIEACKQCGLSHLPKLYQPCHLQEWLQSNVQTSKTLRLVASLEKESRPLLSVLEALPHALEEVVVAVGPVGDFTDAEYGLLRKNGFEAVQLSANVLRVETAAAYILSVVDQAVRSR